jgi:hypothetical protein
MTVEDCDQFIVIDISKTLSDASFAQEIEVRHYLAETHFRRQLPYFRQQRHCFTLDFWSHGGSSPILGSAANAFGNLPITSTRIRVPGANLAIHVACVTPLYNTRTLSFPSYTDGGGLAEEGNLSSQLGWVRTLPPRRWDAQLAGIDIAEISHIIGKRG